jgi:spore germination protein KA
MKKREVKNINITVDKNVVNINKKNKEIISEKIINNKVNNTSLSNKENEVVYIKLSENIDFLKKIYNFPANSDMVFRDFLIGDKIKACLVYFDGMVNDTITTDFILKQLMCCNLDENNNDFNLKEIIKNSIISQLQIKESNNYGEIKKLINVGECAIFIDGLDIAYVCDVKGYQSRKVDKPITENTVRGSQEGFTETLRVNTALIRKEINNENLIIENIEIGDKYKKKCALIYLNNVADLNFVNSVRDKLKTVTADYIAGTGDLEQLIEEKTLFPFPQMVTTELPSRVCNGIVEGRIALIVDGNPFALTVPITFLDMLYTADDDILRTPYKITTKLIRILAILITVFVPSIYLAIVNYHPDVLPIGILGSIVMAKESIPFPFLIEIIVMEIMFEIVQESRLRIPSQLRFSYWYSRFINFRSSSCYC